MRTGLNWQRMAILGALAWPTFNAQAENVHEKYQRPTTLQELLDSQGTWTKTPENEKCFPYHWGQGDSTRYSADFNASLCLRAHLGKDLPVSAMRSEIEARSTLDAFLMSKPLNVMNANAQFVSPLSGSPYGSAGISLMGYQVWSDAQSAPNITWQKDITLLNFDKAVTVPFQIGPIPATLSAGVQGRVDAFLYGQLAIINATGRLVPNVSSGGYAQVAVDVRVARAGAESAFRFVDNTLRLEGNAALALDPTRFPPRALYTAQASCENNLSALQGEINLFAEWLGKSQRFTHQLVAWPGYNQADTLCAFRIDPTPVFEQSVILDDPLAGG